jgi:pyruvate dehydrogenase E1 component alpha subunit
VEKYKTERDPIEGVKAALLKEYGVTEDDLKSIDKEIKDTVAEAAQFSQDSPLPDASELWTDVLKEA